MSWLFGYKKPVSDLPAQGNSDTPMPPAASSSNPDPKAYANRESIYKFDSTALERAAQAAKELERSRRFIAAVDHRTFASFSICDSGVRRGQNAGANETAGNSKTDEGTRCAATRQTRNALSLSLFRSTLSTKRKSVFNTSSN